MIRDSKIAVSLIWCFLALLSGLFASSALAAEIIHRFDAIIKITADGELQVIEKIRVRAEGRQIRRGIYRDFPLIFEDAGGAQHEVEFKLVSISRDGRPEPYRTERSIRLVRIYIGDRDVILPPGNYDYKITYTTNRQIRFFDDYDELLWNVTGNGWEFPISIATARVELPTGSRATDLTAYTGVIGSTAQNAKAVLSDDGNVARFATKQRLEMREGLTIGIKMPKGVISEPSGIQNANWFWLDFKREIIALIVLLAVVAYYFWNWSRIGRDPPKGVAVPRWDAPGDISPALTNYIAKKGLAGKGWNAISSAVLNLAVAGLVELDDLTGDLCITATGNQPQNQLPVGELAILRQIKLNGGELIISSANGEKVKSLQRAFSNAMESEHRGKFYKHNQLVAYGGIALSLAGLAIMVFATSLSVDVLFLLFPLIIGGTMIMVVIVRVANVITAGRALTSRIGAIIGAGIAAHIAFSILLPVFGNITDFITRPLLVSAILGLVMLNVLFFFLLGAPTSLGQRMMDGITGLKTYLNLAEKDRMNLVGVPLMSPRHYETLLPYAVALGVEKPWSTAFDTWLAAAIATGAASAAYRPGWYRGNSMRGGSIGKTMGKISGNLHDSFTAAMPVPKSSSSGFSGGGGSSGGGGGGGGGGGW